MSYSPPEGSGVTFSYTREGQFGRGRGVIRTADGRVFVHPYDKKLPPIELQPTRLHLVQHAVNGLAAQFDYTVHIRLNT